MTVKCTLVFLIISIVVMPITSQNHRWVDPHDMTRDIDQQLKDLDKQDRAKTIENSIEDVLTNQDSELGSDSQSDQTVKNPPNKEYSQAMASDKIEHNSGTAKNSKNSTQKKSIVNDEDAEKTVKLTVLEQPFFRRYVAFILGQLDNILSRSKTESDIELAMRMSLSLQEIEKLRRFSDGTDDSLRDTLDILTTRIISISEAEPMPSVHSQAFAWIKDNFGLLCMIVVTLSVFRIALAVHIRFTFSWFSFFTKMIIIAFVISVPWNWWHLYKLEAAKRYADMLQEMPPDCTPKHKQTLWEGLVNSMSLDVDACTKYHQRMMTDPFWEVPPTKAVAVTITKFLVEPVEHIGSALNVFLQKSLHGLPVYLWPVAIFFSVFMLILTMVMSFGYKVNIMYLFGIEPPAQRNGVNERMLEDENNRLRAELGDLQREREALRNQLRESEYALTAAERRVQAIQPPPYPRNEDADRMPRASESFPRCAESHSNAPYPENLGFQQRNSDRPGFRDLDANDGLSLQPPTIVPARSLSQPAMYPSESSHRNQAGSNAGAHESTVNKGAKPKVKSHEKRTFGLMEEPETANSNATVDAHHSDENHNDSFEIIEPSLENAATLIPQDNRGSQSQMSDNDQVTFKARNVQLLRVSEDNVEISSCTSSTASESGEHQNEENALTPAGTDTDLYLSENVENIVAQSTEPVADLNSGVQNPEQAANMEMTTSGSLSVENIGQHLS